MANSLRTAWEEDRTALNAWLTVPSAWTAELLGSMGFDAVTIDAQHGLAGYQTVLSMLQAIPKGPTPLVRSSWNDPGELMRWLDAGALGVICPLVNTAQEATRLIEACRYPPLGNRSFGPIRAGLRDQDYHRNSNDETVVLAMIETRESMKDLEGIIATEGLDGVYIGTVDLGISLGLPGLGDLQVEELMQAVARILSVCRRHGKLAGIHARTVQEAAELSVMGFRLITVLTDTSVLRESSERILDESREAIRAAS